MRLIDADVLLDEIRLHSESYFADDFAREWVDKQPTIDAEFKWIPCSERLPEIGESVLVSYVSEYFSIDEDKYVIDYGVSISHRNGNRSWSNFFNDEIVAWQKLPLPYKGGKE